MWGEGEYAGGGRARSEALHRRNSPPTHQMRDVMAAAGFTTRSMQVMTDLPVKGQFFHREAENRLFCRLRDAKKLNFK